MEEPANNSTITISSLSYYLIYIQLNMTRSMLIFLIFGNIGNLCNCFVFLQKTLRSNSCSFYLFTSSVVNILALTFSIPTAIYSIDYTDPAMYSLLYCKLRLYIYHTLLMISRYLIIFACIDRACLSSRRATIRNFSQIYKARVAGILTIIFWFIATIHIPIMNTIQDGYCIMPGIYNLIFGIYALIFTGVIPPILMSIFSLITLKNLHSVHVRIHVTNKQTNRLMHQRDFHLTRMLTAQVLIYILTTTPYPLNAFYTAITISVNKSLNRQIIELFISFTTGTFLLFINPSVPFYIYITTSKAFRKEFKVAWMNLWQKMAFKKRNNSTIPNINLGFLTRSVAQQQGDFPTSSATIIRPIPDKQN